MTNLAGAPTLAEQDLHEASAKAGQACFCRRRAGAHRAGPSACAASEETAVRLWGTDDQSEDSILRVVRTGDETR
jgi:hypothetical protein